MHAGNLVKLEAVIEWFIDYRKDFDCVNHINQWGAFRKIGIPKQFILLMTNLYAGQEARE